MNSSTMFARAGSVTARWLGAIGMATVFALPACDMKSVASGDSGRPDSSTDVQAGTASVEMLRTAILSGSVDGVVDALNAVKQVQHRSELVNYVAALWSKRGLDSDVRGQKILDEELVRVNLADVLLQASANDHIEVDTREILLYVRPLVGSTNKHIAMAAASALGSSTESQDIDVLAAAVTDSRDSVFRASVLSLAFMCDPRAGTTLTRLVDASADAERREFLKETKEEAAAHRKATRACRESKEL